MGLPEHPREQPVALNLAMHFGQGALLGAFRGVMAAAGLRGPWASTMFGVIRLTNDQLLENATGAGAPPWTWPRREPVVDLLHKGVYAFATGLVTDALAARRAPGAGQRHAALRPGRHADVGPRPGDASASRSGDGTAARKPTASAGKLTGDAESCTES